MTENELLRSLHAQRLPASTIAYVLAEDHGLRLDVADVLRRLRELGLQPWPERHPEAVAAREFVALARAELERRGEPATLDTIARVVGTSRPHLSACLQGARRATLSAIGDWLDRWAEAGYAEIELVRGPDRVTVRRALPAGYDRAAVLATVLAQLAAYEQRHGLSTAEMRRRVAAGELDEIVDWLMVDNRRRALE